MYDTPRTFEAAPNEVRTLTPPAGEEETAVELVVLSGPDAGRKFVLRETDVIGRGSDASVRLRDPSVSRAHAELERSGDGLILVDKGSCNGTSVNGTPVSNAVLRFGDRIHVGKSELMYLPVTRAEIELAHQRKYEALGKLVAGVAHDLNNLVAAQLAAVEWLESAPGGARLDDPDVSACITDIARAARRARDLGARVLSFARSEEVGTVQLDVGQVVNDALEIARRTFPASVVIRSDVAAGAMVLGNHAELYQLVMNLLVNARDAMPDGGELQVTLRPDFDEDRAELVIADTGPGVPDRVRERIFEPFFTTRRHSGGSGLGLATVRTVAERHGATVTLDDTERGASFRVVLPATRAPRREPSSRTGPMHALNANPLGGVRLLLVDDDAGLRRSLTRLLRRHGLEVQPVASAENALRALDEGAAPQVVLTDFDMPGMSGRELLHRIKQRGLTIPVIFMTGWMTAELPEQLRAAGAEEVLQKPVATDEVERCIARALGLPSVH